MFKIQIVNTPYLWGSTCLTLLAKISRSGKQRREGCRHPRKSLPGKFLCGAVQKNISLVASDHLVIGNDAHTTPRETAAYWGGAGVKGFIPEKVKGQNLIFQMGD